MPISSTMQQAAIQRTSAATIDFHLVTEGLASSRITTLLASAAVNKASTPPTPWCSISMHRTLRRTSRPWRARVSSVKGHNRIIRSGSSSRTRTSKAGAASNRASSRSSTTTRSFPTSARRASCLANYTGQTSVSAVAAPTMAPVTWSYKCGRRLRGS